MLLEVLLVGATAGWNGPRLDKSNEIAAICLGARQQSGVGADKRPRVLEGHCTFEGAAERFTLALDGKCRFRQVVDGPLPDTIGFDGQRAWRLNWSGVPHYADFGDPIDREMAALVISGAWAERGVPLRLTKLEAGAGDIVLNVEATVAKMNATLTLDRSSMRPRSLAYTGDAGQEVWHFGEYRRFGGRSFPTSITDEAGAQTDVYAVDACAQGSSSGRTYSMPSPSPTTTNLDREMEATVNLKRIGSYMFVRPKIDGQDVGWFFLDTGADVLCVDPALARRLGMRPLGRQATSGMVAFLTMEIWRAKEFSLGPISIANPTFCEFDLSQLAKVFRIDIQGVCGYDCLSRGIMDIDPTVSKLNIYARADPILPGNVKWVPIRFNCQIPCVPCSFEGNHTGLFSLDTGSGSTVDFFSPTVARLGMVAARGTKEARTGGAGGAADSLSGNIDYFEIGGHRFANPEVGLQTTDKGMCACPYLDGNVGMGFMSHFRLILDYRNRRVAFVEQPEKTQ